MDKPSSSSAGTDTQRAQRLRLHDSLGRVAEVQASDLRFVHDFLAWRETRDPLIRTDAQRRQLDAAEAELKKAGATDPEQLTMYFDQISGLLAMLEGQTGDTAKQKLALVMELPLTKAIIAYQKVYAGVLDENVQSMAKFSGANTPELQITIRSLQEDAPLLEPPVGAPQALAKECQDLVAAAAALRLQLAAALDVPPPALDAKVGEAVRTFAGRKQKYEEQCQKASREIFLKEMGFPPDCTEEELSAFALSLARPIAPPEQARDPKMRTDPNVLALHKQLQERRSIVSTRVTLALRRNLSGSDGKAQVEGVTDFLINRDLYERRILQQPKADNDKWLLYMGVAVNEAAEEFLENSIGWRALNEKTLQKIPILRDVPAATRAITLKAWETVCAQMGKVGVPVETLGKMFSFLGRMPMPKGFWSELLVVESPVTVLLWGMYLHESPNKVKATMQFASFLMLGKATTRLALSAGNAMRAMGLLRVAPKNPYALFAIGLVVAFASADQLEKLSTWADKLIPESATKDFVGNLFATVSGDFAIGGLEELAEVTGVSKVDPDRDFRSYMTRPGNLASPGDMFTGDYYHTLDDWNKRVDQVTADAKGRESPMTIELWKLRRIDNLQEWSQRQSVYLHIHTASLADQESKLESELRKLGKLGPSETLGGLELATRDGNKLRNDKEVRYALSTGKSAPGLQKLQQYIDEQVSKAGGADKAKDPFYLQCVQYRELLQDVAKDVGLYNHLGVYKRDTWLGDLARYGRDDYVTTTEYVQSGLVQSVAEAMRRNRAVARSSYPDMKPEQYAAELAKAVRTEEKIGLVESLGNDFEALYKEWKGPGINIFKGAQSLNVPNITIRDELFQLMMQVHNTAKQVPEPLMKDVYDSLQQLATSREIVTSAHLRVIREKLTDVLLKAKAAANPVWEVQKAVERFTKLGSCTLFVQGDLPGELLMDGSRRVDYVRDFVHQVISPSSDFAVLQSQSQTGDMRLFQFSCYGGDSSKWTVQVSGAQRQFYWRGKQAVNSVNYTPTKTISYQDFVSQQPEMAKNLEPKFQKIEQWYRDRDTARTKYRDEYVAKYEADWKAKKGDVEILSVRRIYDYRTQRDVEVPVSLGKAGKLLEDGRKDVDELKKSFERGGINPERLRDNATNIVARVQLTPDEMRRLESPMHRTMAEQAPVITAEFIKTIRLFRKYQEAIIADEKTKPGAKEGWRIFDRQYEPEKIQEWFTYLEQKEGLFCRHKDLIVFACSYSKMTADQQTKTSETLEKAYPKQMIRAVVDMWDSRSTLANYPEVLQYYRMQMILEQIDRESGRATQADLLKEADKYAGQMVDKQFPVSSKPR